MKGTMILTESEKETEKYCYYIKNALVTERKTERYKNDIILFSFFNLGRKYFNFDISSFG